MSVKCHRCFLKNVQTSSFFVFFLHSTSPPLQVQLKLPSSRHDDWFTGSAGCKHLGQSSRNKRQSRPPVERTMLGDGHDLISQRHRSARRHLPTVSSIVDSRETIWVSPWAGKQGFICRTIFSPFHPDLTISTLMVALAVMRRAANKVSLSDVPYSSDWSVKWPRGIY